MGRAVIVTQEAELEDLQRRFKALGVPGPAQRVHAHVIDKILWYEGVKGSESKWALAEAEALMV